MPRPAPRHLVAAVLLAVAAAATIAQPRAAFILPAEAAAAMTVPQGAQAVGAADAAPGYPRD